MRYFTYCRKSQDSEDRQVASIPSQEAEAARLAATRNGAQVVDVLKEAQSAKRPGRPVFDYMLDRIEAGEADGIIAWHPDRLARNAADGGRIIDLLDTGKLKDLRFCTYTFENNAQGKLMLSMLFSFAKYYVDALSDNIRRGQRTQIAGGWRPSTPPLGYLFDRVAHRVIPDPDRFDAVRRIWKLVLSESQTPTAVARMASATWGLRTRQTKKRGGHALSRSGVYAILKNPFYAGLFMWNGQIHEGKHQAMITVEEFDRVQRYLRRKGHTRPSRKHFAYTGIVKCSCGLSVTANNTTNRYGYQYTYYHCTQRHPTFTCHEPYVRVESLETQIEAFLETLSVAPLVRDALAARVGQDADRRDDMRETQAAALRKEVGEATNELANLTTLRIRELIRDEEFLGKRNDLELRLRVLNDKLGQLEQPELTLEPFEILISFSNRAVECFRRATPGKRRLILQTVGLNPVLRAGKLSIQAKKPFRQDGRDDRVSLLCTVVHDVRTFFRKDPAMFGKLITDLKRILSDDPCNEEEQLAARKRIEKGYDDRRRRKAA
jgi:site-specific DNA recombinase